MICKEKQIRSGREVLINLALEYPQLYLEPGDEGAELFREVFLRQKDVSDKSLKHFVSNDGDRCFFESTPAGVVRIVELHDRSDFETFLMCIGSKCRKVEIPVTQGAVFYKGHICPDRVDALIVLSAGPYSGVQAKDAGFDEDEWIRLSLIIRKAHECTHYVMRSLYEGKTDAVWDELVADAAGLYAAFGRYDARLAKQFLGITGDSFTGGRLENYVSSDETVNVQELTARILPVIDKFAQISDGKHYEDCYEYACSLEDLMDELWK